MSSGLHSRRNPTKKRKPRLPERRLAPLRAITYIDGTGVLTIGPETITAEGSGWKAFGLSSVPMEWVPRFLVISSECFRSAQAKQKLQGMLKDGLALAGVQGSVVMVRSSGIAETIEHRGRLVSGLCSPDEIITTVEKWLATLSESIRDSIHWIVQEHVQCVRQGHLSNERRVSKEKRDWVAELELKEEAIGYSIPVAVRRWRDGDRIADSLLHCTSELEISFCLKRVAMWAERLTSRMHFEWVWNGSEIRVVQADIAEPPAGVDPHSLIPSQIPGVEIGKLSGFKLAAASHCERYPKLRNAKLYQTLGYSMPKFYVLDNATELAAILGGQISAVVDRDLSELTKRPLILRTDGTNIPPEKREMLPRSEHLRTPEDAKAWLFGPFRAALEKDQLQPSSLCLIGHHFIPSLASAWARAEPGKRFVRIEALWGLPEGLYWYSHDTYEVDTKESVIKQDKQKGALDYNWWERLRYKGTFIAPDARGSWVPNQTKVPLDWRSSINKQDWLFEIANTTRLIAEREKFAVAVMWFIGNHTAATKHAVLPWFHDRSRLETAPKAAPRRKLTTSRDLTLRSVPDWENLQQQVAAGKRVERVIVEPTDSNLIRNVDFARDLADFAAANKIVIELAGGVLSHAYYVLQRQGAQVECTDLFGTDEDVVEYNKLVRDKIPRTIEARGERVELVRLRGDALTSELRQKLVEEALEALDVKSGDDLVGELADVEEVIAGLRTALRLSKEQIETERLEKRKRRGAFRRGYMLTKTSTPHSLEKEVTTEPMLDLTPNKSKGRVISNPADIPSTPIYRRPDLRQLEQELEKLFVFETEMKRTTNLTETVNFTLPTDRGATREFSLTVELRRERSSFRTSVRLRMRPSQLVIDFPES